MCMCVKVLLGVFRCVLVCKACIGVFNCMLCVKVCIVYIYADLCKSIYDVELLDFGSIPCIIVLYLKFLVKSGKCQVLSFG